MNSLEALEDLFDLLCEREHTNSEHSFWLKLYQEVKKDLELLNSLLNIFEKDILEAFDPYYKNGDNIITDYLIRHLGMDTLEKLKERLNKRGVEQ